MGHGPLWKRGHVMIIRSAHCGIFLAVAALLSCPAPAEQLPVNPRTGRAMPAIMKDIVIFRMKFDSLIGDGNLIVATNPTLLASGKVFSTTQTRRSAGAV